MSAAKESIESRPQITPRRLMLALEAAVKLQTKSVEVDGKDHLKEIPPDSKVIVATTHLSDLDVPMAAYVLGNELNLIITDQSVHHHFTEEGGSYIEMILAGKENFIPIDHKKSHKGKEPSFNPDNFAPMAEALEKGKDVVFAAHAPSKKHEKNLKNDRGGYGAVYLAEISDAVVLPVAVEVIFDGGTGMYENHFKTFFKKPDVKVHIGAPFKLEKIKGIERFSELMKRHSETGPLTIEEFKEFSGTKAALKLQSKFLMSKLVALFPDSGK